MFISGVNDTGNKMFGGVNDTADKFMSSSWIFFDRRCAGVVDTGDKFFTGVVDTAEKFSPVTTTPMINFSLVSTTQVNNYRR
jgi:hypothetical protein